VVVDEQGKEPARSEPVNSTVTDNRIGREAGWDATAIAGRKIRLKFELEGAKLYGFQIQRKSLKPASLEWPGPVAGDRHKFCEINFCFLLHFLPICDIVPECMSMPFGSSSVLTWLIRGTRSLWPLRPKEYCCEYRYSEVV